MDIVIFACRHNAGRSQMAAAFFNRMIDPARAKGLSAGTTPADRVHPEVLQVMREKDVDLAGVKPQKLTSELAAGARYMITMGCGEECPFVPGVTVVDWQLEDPKGQTIDRVRELRDEIEKRVRDLVATNGWRATAPA